MQPEIPRKRLDEILIEEGLISEEEIREALLSQRAEGGKLGSHLLRHRYVDEAGLVRALSTQMHCPSIVLSSLRIPKDVVERIPKEVALARRVIPFEYDAEQNALKIACEDPTDESLASELSFIVSGAEIKLHVAAQIALDTAIAKCYLGRDESIYGTMKPAVLLVSDEEQTAPLIQSLLQADDYEVVVTNSTDNVIDLLENQRFHTVIIENSLSEDGAGLADRVRRISPSTVVRCCENASSLLVDDSPAVETELFLKNIDLLTSLLSSKAQLPVNHSIRVARYTDRLCRNLKLPDKDRLIITNAAYLHNLAISYYGAEGLEDHRQIVQITLTLLASLNYSPVVLDVLRSMYVDLPEDHLTRLPLEILGGNILTAVDMVCRDVPSTEHLSFDKFDALQRRLRDLAGTSLLSEVVEGLIDMLQGRILDSHSAQGSAQVMVYAGDSSARQLIGLRLRNEGIRTVLHGSTASLIELYHRSKPDIIILAIDGDPAAVTCVLDDLAGNGIGLEGTPTLLLTDGLPVSNIMGFLDRGVEDVILLDQNLDLLVCKLHTLAAKTKGEPTTETAAETIAETIAETAVEAGAGGPVPETQGRLTDINLVDLLQVLGPGRKTARIVVESGESQAGNLTLYLDQGHITFAETGNRTGPDAVYEALSWADGIWKVESVSAEHIPPSNNDLSNESILMEGCRALEEELQIVP
ncbi:DUF4388 domain-containing protein [Candidatus Eisenbacteria bacterium]|uniref:DUF4388 domain-containing protein n=1 Tax=Eiseniibacteriota bacterium TaxID=2212470 RepID=A0ABV6YN77_UNCEI